MPETSKQVHSEISDWLGDIVALETHVEEAMDAQLKLDGDPTIASDIQRLHDTVRDSKQRAVAFQQDYGSTAGNPVIKAGSNLTGKVAGLIDKLRNDSVSKALRDDYTAYNHVAIAYTMLYTAALAFADDETSAFAKAGLTTYASLVQDLNHLIPQALLQDLASGDHAPVIAPDVLEKARQTIDGVWKATN